ncbi:hypothetical protein HGB24_01315 [Candidatus Saccharibacteria bacterium]|nr:hypothetical protein [Candidatus Saccharibacteria bacterium]
MALTADIVKSGGKRQTEKFVRDKLKASIIAACRSVRAYEGEAENTADLVCDAVESWLATRPEVTSGDLRIVTSRHLKKYHPEAAYLYEQYRITI